MWAPVYRYYTRLHIFPLQDSPFRGFEDVRDEFHRLQRYFREKKVSASLLETKKQGKAVLPGAH